LPRQFTEGQALRMYEWLPPPNKPQSRTVLGSLLENQPKQIGGHQSFRPLDYALPSRAHSTMKITLISQFNIYQAREVYWIRQLVRHCAGIALAINAGKTA